MKPLYKSLLAISCALALSSTPAAAELDVFSEAGPQFIETSAPSTFIMTATSRQTVNPGSWWGYSLAIGTPKPRFWTIPEGYDSLAYTGPVPIVRSRPAQSAITRVSVQDDAYTTLRWQDDTVGPGNYVIAPTMRVISVDRRLRHSVRLSAADLAALPFELSYSAGAVRSMAPQQIRDAADQIMAEHQGDLVKAVKAIDKWVCDRLTYSADPQTQSIDASDMAAILQHGKGACGHYSGLFAGLANAAGIPARIVGGAWVNGAGTNAQTTVTPDTHAWAEVYLPRIGWVEVEPQNMENPNGDPFLVERFHIKGGWGASETTLVQTAGPTPATNILPVAQIASFTSNGQVKLNQTLTLAASAMDADGFVVEVAFYQVGPSGAFEFIGASSSVPYTIQWTPTVAGKYRIYAFAYDNMGAISPQSGAPEATVSATAPAAPGARIVPDHLANISTRLRVGTGDNVLIGGFIVTSPAPEHRKRVVVRAVGPSMGMAGTLANPMLTLHDSTGAVIARNDNWRSAQIGGLITGSQTADIQAAGLAPGNDNEAALIAELPAGSYTVIVSGVNNTQGIGLVEVYDLNGTGEARLANISTRGPVGTGDNVMIGGTIVQGLNAQRILVRANGPSLAAAGITNALANPTLTLYNSNGTPIATNDNWRSDNAAAIEATGLAPGHDNEAAILATVLPGSYTAIVSGVNGGTGVSLVEFYHLP